MQLIQGFQPCVTENSRVLVLGSFPSVMSRSNGFYYGNNRNNIEVGRADNLASLLNTYQSGKAQTEQDFNTKLAEAYNVLQQGIAADRAAYNNSLASIMAYLG